MKGEEGGLETQTLKPKENPQTLRERENQNKNLVIFLFPDIFGPCLEPSLAMIFEMRYPPCVLMFSGRED